jgi:hypothetical protein
LYLSSSPSPFHGRTKPKATTHHVHILEMNGDSYRLKQSKRRQRDNRSAGTLDDPAGD